MPDQVDGAAAPESVNITPSPRILRVLAEIEFDSWQCIAELVDNSFDEFLDIKRSDVDWSEGHVVDVSLANEDGDEAVIVVADNGRGMSLSQITDSVRAGFSGNDPFSKLGLFGMGFNVASARLGSVTTFLSTAEGDPEWVGVRIDVESLGQDFQAPVIRESKRSPDEHGTRVIVSGLHPIAIDLSRPQPQRRLRERLGAVYSYLLENEGFQLRVNGVDAVPWRHCVWSETRAVTRGGEVIQAVIPIEHELEDQMICRLCGEWNDGRASRCGECQSDQLELRTRKIWGWVGIARNLESSQYGLDFLRNGRKIMRFDKSLFAWSDPDDLSDAGSTEYPVEVPNNQGRIIGEVHLDHVRVSYLKDSFDGADRGWHKAVQVLRGEGPLLPRRAKELGYSENVSPLARLHRGYRRNNPGVGYLTPGDGKSRKDTADWVREFRRGTAEYQDDSRWWEAAVEHDRLVEEERQRKADAEAAAEADVNDPTREFAGGGDRDLDEDDEPDAPAPTPETAAERIERLGEAGRLVPELTGEFSVTGVPGRPIQLRTLRVDDVVQNMEGEVVPVWITGERDGFVAFVGLRHPLFTVFDDEPVDLVLLEVAHQLLVRSEGRTSKTIGAIVAELKNRYLNSRSIDVGRLVPEATTLMRDVQEQMVPLLSASPDRPWHNVLVDAERHVTSDRIIDALRTADTQAAIDSGEYVRFLPAGVISRIVEEWPEAFFDGRLFVSPYADLSSSTAQRRSIATVTSYLDDIAWLTDVPTNAPRAQLVRARLSLQLLPDELVRLDDD